jgi:predicted methyltransferase
MLRATDLAHLLLRQVIKPGDWAVDATVGNGHDTLWLAQQVGASGRVFGFDVQAAALAEAAKRVDGCSQVELFHSGHERLTEQLPADAKGRLAAVMFNLGYLPGAAKDIVTRTDTTLAALGQSLGLLAVGGHVTLVLYPGHPEGAEEAAAARTFAASLSASFAANIFGRINALRPAPELLAIERLR